ncbi:MAG: sensor histidine kinase [Ahniella sp.]|nr:sensor histidine kinase [Ahniella sp.]
MSEPDTLRQRLTEPSLIAAVVTWLAVLAMTVIEPGRQVGAWDPETTRTMAVAAAVGFMLLMASQTAAGKLWPARTHLLLVLAQAALALLVAAMSRSGSGPILLIIVMSELVTRTQARTLWWIFGVVNLGLFLIHWQNWGLSSAVIAGFSYAGFQLFAIIITRYASRSESTSMALREVNAHLLATRSLLAESARDQERLRIARELHDVAGHKLTALKLQLRSLARRPELAHDEAVQMSGQLADELLNDMRAVVQQMREQDGMDLRAAIEELVAPFPRPRAIIEIAEDARVDTVAKADAIVRAVQEALTNAARHGDAQTLWITLKRIDDRIEVDIRDDGRAVSAGKAGNGLQGMHERFREVGGDVSVRHDLARGFQIHAWVPMT